MKKRSGNTRGQWVVFVIIALAIAMGALAVWWHDRLGDRAQQFWGTSTAQLIRHSERVEALRLGGCDMPVETLEVGPVIMQVCQIEEISSRPGLVHARHAMIEDASFDWLADPPDVDPSWNFAIRFSGAEESVTVILDTTDGFIRAVGGSRQGQLVDERRTALNDYLSAVFAETN